MTEYLVLLVLLVLLGLLAFWAGLKARSIRKNKKECPDCEGRGSHQMQTRVRGFSVIKPIPCRKCRGRGLV